jgi:hypothetical protein
MNQTPTEAFLWTDSAQIHPRLIPGNTSFKIGSHFSSPLVQWAVAMLFKNQGLRLSF